MQGGIEMNTGFERARRALRCSWVVVLAALSLTGCGGSGDPTASPAPPASGADTGTLLVSVTDAEGDFVSYSVDVLSVTLLLGSCLLQRVKVTQFGTDSVREITFL
jgi:hypothetical protein